MTLLTKGMGAIIKGKAQGGRIGKLAGGPMRQGIGRLLEKLGGSEKGKPHSTRAGRRAAGSRRLKRGLKEISTPYIKEAVGLEEVTKLLKGLRPERTKKGLGGVLKGIGKIAKKLKPKKIPKPGPENKFKYQGKDPFKESKFDWIDRMDAKAAWEAGEKPPFKIGKLAKNILKGTAGAVGGGYAYGKWKRHLKKKKKDKEKK